MTQSSFTIVSELALDVLVRKHEMEKAKRKLEGVIVWRRERGRKKTSRDRGG